MFDITARGGAACRRTMARAARARSSEYTWRAALSCSKTVPLRRSVHCIFCGIFAHSRRRFQRCVSEDALVSSARGNCGGEGCTSPTMFWASPQLYIDCHLALVQAEVRVLCVLVVQTLFGRMQYFYYYDAALPPVNLYVATLAIQAPRTVVVCNAAASNH